MSRTGSFVMRAWRWAGSDRCHGGCRSVEAALRGQRLESPRLEAAAARAGDGATGAGGNDFKIELARRAVLRALRTVADQESL